MASYTANYNLRKDASTDNYDVAVVNQNLDEIDEQMHQNEVASTTPFTGASSSANGEKGIVPRPMTGDEENFLCGDGTWKPVQGGGGGGSSADEMTLAEYNELTEQQKNDGTIRFIPENPYGIITDVDMSTITNLSESRITVTPSADEIEIDFDNSASSSIGGTFYVSTPVDVTNYDYLKYDLTTGDCYNSLHSDTNPLRNLGIGLCRTDPSSWQYAPNVTWAVSNIYDVTDINSTFTDEIIDVSALTGQYYFVVAFVAWEATISDLKLATAGGYPSQIKYMSKTYADGTGGGSGGGIDYSTSEQDTGLKWIDNSSIYQKTINIVNSSSVSATRDVDLSSYVPSGARVIEFSGIYEYVYSSKNYGMAIGSNSVYGYMWDNAYKLKLDFGSGSFESDEINLTIKYTKSS